MLFTVTKVVRRVIALVFECVVVILDLPAHTLCLPASTLSAMLASVMLSVSRKVFYLKNDTKFGSTALWYCVVRYSF